VVRSAAIWAGFAGLVAVAFPPMLLGYPLVLIDPRRALSDAYFRALGRALMRINPLWSVEVHGREQLDRGGPYVIVVNHQSLADLIVMCFLRHPTKYLAKMSLLRIPIFGWGLRIAGEVGVERGDRDSGARAMRQLGGWLDRGVSICVFPEGTRSPDGTIQEFRHGAFRLALERGLPVVPVVIAGARDVLPKHSFVFEDRASVVVRVLEPVPTATLGSDAAGALAADVRARMQRALAEIEGG
jgi:1-acyl-sn-glycerol-3-phosphate acyltransferase